MVDRLVAVNDANYRLPTPVLQALATDLETSGTDVGDAVESVVSAVVPEVIEAEAPSIVSSKGFSREYKTVIELMATDAPTGSKVKITGFAQWSDGTDVAYEVHATLPADQVLKRIAVPLADGRCAVPINTKLDAPTSADVRGIDELVAAARTYVTAGSQLVYDTTREGPLSSPTPVHSRYTAPYPITCSVFMGCLLRGYTYATTTYVADSNTRAYDWGNTFPVREYTSPALQSFRLLQYYWNTGQAFYYRAGSTELRRGDFLFYCKQDPEGAGTGGVFFMNNYHIALFIGEGDKVIHSYSPLSGNGVVEQAFSLTPVADLCFVVRPNISHTTIRSLSLSSVAMPSPFAGTYQYWYQSDMFNVAFDFTTVSTALVAGTSYTILSGVQSRPLRNISRIIMGSDGTPIRATLTTAGVLSLYSATAVDVGVTLYGAVSYPV